jgi:hypothetical protein
MPSLPSGKKRANWKDNLEKRKAERTWWLVKLDFKSEPDLYRWLCAEAARFNVSVAHLCKAILRDAQDGSGEDAPNSPQ